MAVTSTAVRSGPFTPNGVTTNYPFTFQAASADEVRVYRQASDGSKSDIASGFIVTLNEDHTGTVIFTQAPVAGDQLYIESAVTFEQALEFTNQGPFLAETHEEGFDRSAARDIWLRARVAIDPAPNSFLATDADSQVVAVPGGINILPAIADSLAFTPTAGVPANVAIHLRQNRKILDAVPYALKAAAMDGTSTDILSPYIQTILSDVEDAGGGTIDMVDSLIRFNTPLFIGSNTKLIGNSHLYAMYDEWDSSGDADGTPFSNCAILNRNFNALTRTDTDILIEGVFLDMSSNLLPLTGNPADPQFVNGDAHGIFLRRMFYPRVHKAKIKGAASGTAFLGCLDSEVVLSRFLDCVNCWVDHWDAAGSALAQDNIARNTAGRSISQGIQFTGTGTLLEDETSLVALVAGNRLFGCRDYVSLAASAIITNANDAGSYVYNFHSSNNYVEDADAGFVAEGAGGSHSSETDWFKNVTSAPVNVRFTATNLRIIDPTFEDCLNADVQDSLIRIGSGSGHEVRGVRTINSGAVGYENIVYLLPGVTGCLVDVSVAETGTVGRVADAGTGNRVIDYDPAGLKAWSRRGYMVGPTVYPEATNPSHFVSVNAAGDLSINGAGGLESVSSTFGAGYACKLKAIDNGAGDLTVGLGVRVNAAAWTLRASWTATRCNLAAGMSYAINNVDCLSGQGAAVPNAAGANPTKAEFDALLTQLRAIKIIAP